MSLHFLKLVLVASPFLTLASLSVVGCGSSSGPSPLPVVTDDHGDDATSATLLGAPQPPSAPPNPVAPWLQGTGTIGVPADVDWFSFTLTAGIDYTFATTVDPGSDTIIRLIDSDGITVLIENDDFLPNDPFSALTTQVPADGVYYIEVRQKVPNATGGYRVFAKQGPFTAL